jgi:hypothetical protein
MADQTVVRMGDNSPEYIAYRLLERVAYAEAKTLDGVVNTGWSKADKEWILDTYCECLNAVTRPWDRERKQTVGVY